MSQHEKEIADLKEKNEILNKSLDKAYAFIGRLYCSGAIDMGRYYAWMASDDKPMDQHVSPAPTD